MGKLVIKGPQSIDVEYVVNDLKSVKSMVESLIIKDYKKDASKIAGLLEKKDGKNWTSGNNHRELRKK
jgi:hypothetical protein